VEEAVMPATEPDEVGKVGAAAIGVTNPTRTL
jgi:hypothetical protein